MFPQAKGNWDTGYQYNVTSNYLQFQNFMKSYLWQILFTANNLTY